MYSAHLMSEPESFWFQLQEWAMPFDGVWANEAGPQVNSEPILNAVSLFKQFYDTTFPQGSDDSTATRQWADGQIAQQLIVSAAVNVYKASAPDLYPHIRSYSLPWESKRSIARIHPITVNVNGPHVDASKEFVKFLYTPENYRELLTRQLDVIPAYDVGGLEDYFADLHWLTGYEDINPTTPPDIMGDSSSTTRSSASRHHPRHRGAHRQPAGRRGNGPGSARAGGVGRPSRAQTPTPAGSAVRSDRTAGRRRGEAG